MSLRLALLGRTTDTSRTNIDITTFPLLREAVQPTLEARTHPALRKSDLHCRLQRRKITLHPYLPR